MIKLCTSCERSFSGRADAKTCSAKCRKRLQRKSKETAITVRVEKSLKAHAKLLGLAALSPFANQRGFSYFSDPSEVSQLREQQPTIGLNQAEPTPEKSHFSLKPVLIGLVLVLLIWPTSAAILRKKNNPDSSFASRFLNSLLLQPVKSNQTNAGLENVTPVSTAEDGKDGADGKDGTNGTTGATGEDGSDGATGATGSVGVAGATGTTGPSGTATCANGDCLSLQASTPGVAETGHLNITGTAVAGTFSGSGASLTTLNATNISSGTVADARLTNSVTLQGNVFNGASELVQTTAGGLLPALDGSNLTNLTGANVSGSISGNAGTATALAANPTDCASDTYATTIAASGNLTCASITDASLTANVTLQGNSFNGASELVQLTAGGILPVLSGANLTALNASNLSSGTVASGRVSGSYTGITGTGVLDAGSITSNFGAIDTGADNITTTGTLQGTTSVLTGLLDNTSAAALDIGTTNATAINLKQSTSVTGNIDFSGKLLEDGNEVFSGLISAFTTSCPTGWTEYTGARGRYLVGTPSGGTDEATVGTALTNSENRPVGQHNHATTDPGHTHTPTGGLKFAITNSATMLASGGASVYQTTNAHSGTASATTGITVDNSGTTAGTNAPYIQVHYCQKTAGSDLAEWTASNEVLTAGMIVSIDQNDNKKLVSSKTAYDELVAGVISTDPGWILGKESKESSLLALSGRVPVYVSLENGDIKRGDPITSSSTPGVGMKATKAGMIIGRAMEDFNSSSKLSDCGDINCGVVTVFLNSTWQNPRQKMIDTISYVSFGLWGVTIASYSVKKFTKSKFKINRIIKKSSQ